MIVAPVGNRRLLCEVLGPPPETLVVDVAADSGDRRVVDEALDLDPGDVYVFNAMTVHGAPGNSTANRRRRGYTVRYCGDDVFYDPRVGVSSPILIDGKAAGDRIDSEQCPLIYAD